MDNSEQSNQKSKFRIENLSEKTRKKIFGFSIFILMLVILVAWVTSLQSAFNQIKAKPTTKIFNNEDLTELQESLNNIIDQTKKSGVEIQNKIDELNQLATSTSTATTTETTSTSTSTSSPELNQKDIKKLKEIILEQQLD